MKIFEDSKPKVCSKKRKKQKPSGSNSLANDKLKSLNPMAFAILALKSEENPNNDFIRSSFIAISEKPEKLTPKWIKSINKFVDSTVNSIMLDPPPIKEGERVDISDVVVIKVSDPKDNSAYPMPALICADERGWKFYFKTTKAYSFKAGDKVSFRATLSAHKEGISFMRRPSAIIKS